MKTLDFTKGIIKENKDTQRVDEFLMTIIAATAMVHLCSVGAMSMLNVQLTKMEETRKHLEELGLLKDPKQRQQEKEERKHRKEQEKAERKRLKAEEKQKKLEEKEVKKALKEREETQKEARKALLKATKQMIALQETIDRMPDGQDKDDMVKKLDVLKRTMDGEATKKDYETLQTESKRELTEKEQKQLTTCNEIVDKISDEKAEKNMKENNISLTNLSKSASKAGVIEAPIEDADKDNEQMIADDDKEDNDDSKDDPKDEPKEEIKDMEVEDPETGKKVMRKVHIGPQGGKYYWPDGAPHDAEHKVYVDK